MNVKLQSFHGSNIWHAFCVHDYMKVAIPLFRNGVSPRIDIADGRLIYDIDNGRKEKCSLTFEHAAQLISILQKNEIARIKGG